LPVEDHVATLFAIDHHILVEQAVHADVIEGHIDLHLRQVLLEIGTQCLTHAPATHAHLPIGSKRRTWLRVVHCYFHLCFLLRQ
jgi:hypothetical protein